MRSRRLSVKFVVFAFVPLIVLMLAAETTLRARYFFAHGHDWNYLTAPFSSGEPSSRVKMMPSRASGPMVFQWPTPCADREIYSVALRRMMPRTWDANCFRGDRVTAQKPAGEFRIFFVGGSTVEDAQSDPEIMTVQFKNALRLPGHGQVTVVNAGRTAYESGRILELYESTISALGPDAVFYYEAWNEQPFGHKNIWTRADEALASLQRSRMHRALYYNSMLYTYLLEKYQFAASSRSEAAVWRRLQFWKNDLTGLRSNFTSLVRRVRQDRVAFVFVTQVVDWPRSWKGVDTFDYTAVDGLLDRLKADSGYVYDVKEISALNQRLTVGYTIALCRDLDVPVINILEGVEALGTAERNAMFLDLGHRTAKGNTIVGELIAGLAPARLGF